MKKMAQSIEPNIADLANGWLKSYGLDYKLEQESLNAEIDKALNDYFTKNGGSGAKRPDTKLLKQDKSLNFFPVLIEYKGYKGKLEKLDADGQVENRKTKTEPHFKNINSFAVNGAVHYANALLHHKGYAAIIIQRRSTGRAKEYNQRILSRHTLLASIKMPVDIFIGKSSVQTNGMYSR